MKSKIVFLLLVVLCVFLPELSGRKRKPFDLPMARVNYKLDSDLFVSNAELCLRNIYWKESGNDDMKILSFEEAVYCLYKDTVIAEIKFPRRLLKQKARIDKAMKGGR